MLALLGGPVGPKGNVTVCYLRRLLAFQNNSHVRPLAVEGGVSAHVRVHFSQIYGMCFLK